jgi:hypothetical protein
VRRPSVGSASARFRKSASNTPLSSVRGGCSPSVSSNRETFHFEGSPPFGFDADQSPQRFVAAQLGQARFGRHISQSDRQHDHAPQDGDGIVVAPLGRVSGSLTEQSSVGERGEQVAESLEGQAVLKTVPGDQGLGVMDEQGDDPCREGGGAETPALLSTQHKPDSLADWGKKTGKLEFLRGDRARFANIRRERRIPHPANANNTLRTTQRALARAWRVANRGSGG